MGPTSTSVYIKLTCALLLVLCFFQTGRLQNSLKLFLGSPESSPATIRSISSRKPRLADGCYHVFLDVGSNIGVHARFLYEPDKYPLSLSSVAAFATEFGAYRDNRDFCIFAFEPNPKFEKRHLDLKAAYEGMGWKYHPLFAGASNADGNFTFYHTHMVNASQETGFSAVAAKTLYGTEATARVVPIIRLATFILEEVRERIIPDQPYVDHPLGPRVVMKLDVEGLEYKIFPDLLTSGALCSTIHFLMGEFHHGSAYHNFFPMNVTSDGKNVIDNNGAKRLATTFLNMLEISENCLTKVSLEDDESYKEDPVEYPSPTEGSNSSNAA